MRDIERVVDNIYNTSKIPFQLRFGDYEIYKTPLFEMSPKCLKREFEIEYTKCCIQIDAAFSYALDLLAFFIKDKLREAFIQKRSLIQSLLIGEKIDENLMRGIIPVINDEFYIINVYIEDEINIILEYIEECYSNSKVEILAYSGSILIIGQLEEVTEHVKSIKETIDNTVAGKYYISYKKVHTTEEFADAYESTVAKINIAKKYSISDHILDQNKVIIEWIIDSVSEEVKDKIFRDFNYGFSELDNEMIKTIDAFFKCGLNLSDSAKKLYIHRNTLIYRLDKIEKLTSYDIREFNDAVIFKIVFSMWKEKKAKKS